MRHLLIIALMLITTYSFTQTTNNTIERKGFIFGFGVGGGVVSIADSYD